MRTRDFDEAVDSITRISCPHTVEVMGRAHRIDVRLDVSYPTSLPMVELSYDAPVKIHTRASCFVMMHAARGSASIAQRGRTAEWRQGQTMPISAGIETRLWFDQPFAQKSVVLDVEMLETQCRRWLGRPLDRPLRFGLRPLSDDLNRTWQRSLASQWSVEGSQLAFAPAAKAAFDEYLMTLLLHHHPHSYSAEMSETVLVPVPGLVRQAERYMADNAEAPVTVSDVADHLGVSVRSLQAGFRSWRNTTPSAHLRWVRLQRAHDDLLRADGHSNVTTVALQYGFSHLGRFSAYYQSAFGEAPSTTLRRGRSSTRT